MTLHDKICKFMEAQKIIDIIKRRRDDQRDRAGFRSAAGMREDAQVNFLIAEEYDSLLAEIEGRLE